MLQYSSIPLLQIIHLRHSQLKLPCLKGPVFQGCKKKAQTLTAPGLGESVFRKVLHAETSRTMAVPSPPALGALGSYGHRHIGVASIQDVNVGFLHV